MSNIIIIMQKILFLILLIGSGIAARKFKLVSEEGENVLSRLLVDFMWPSSIFFSIISQLQARDIFDNILLPVSALVTAFTGLGLGLLGARLFGFRDDERKIFIYHSAINNFVFMVIPFVALFFGERGLGLLFLHNLGYILFLWIVGVSVLQGKAPPREMFRRLLTPGFLATIFGIIIVLTGLNNHMPGMVLSFFDTLGAPTMVIAMLVAGSRIYVLGFKSFKLNKWNISLGLIRLVLVPGLLFFAAILLRPYVSDQILIVFMLVNVVPVSVNSIALAKRYNSSPELAAQGIVFTHVFGILTMSAFIALIQLYFGF
ncbi:MAG: AEC family transporter [Spirochaetales bacterium]|nr:AEC family transporter [Spirochaetales bacterium]